MGLPAIIRCRARLYLPIGWLYCQRAYFKYIAGGLEMAEQKQMKLGALLLAEGGSASGWRHPDAGTKGGAEFGRFKEWARQAEAGKLDLVFIADVLYITDKTLRSIWTSWSHCRC